MMRACALPRWLGAIAALAVGVLIGGGACAQAAAPAPPSYYGANVQPIFEKGFEAPSAWNGLIAAMSADDLSVARMDANWSWAEPTAPVNGTHTYTWNPAGDPTHSLDNLVTLFASNHVRMLAVLAGAPKWAGAGGQELVAAHDPDFVAYAAAFAARYGEGGSFWTDHPQLPYLPVQQFEIWT